ncbi:MAG: ABC transporter ATP-binding protein [Candidatus Cryptobacteroides sp.]
MIDISNLILGYGGRTLLSAADVHIPEGSLVALLGRNGTGKSTFLRAASGLSEPLSGAVSYDGVPVSRMSGVLRASVVSVVSTGRVRVQDFTVRDFVALGRSPYTDWLGRLSDEDVRIVDNAISIVGMTEFSERTMDRMSDGECQKVMVARAVAQDTPYILLDEPTSFLDYPNKRMLISLLKSLTVGEGGAKRRTIIFSAHDISLALEYCDSVLLVNEGNMGYIKNTEASREGLWKILDPERIF